MRQPQESWQALSQAIQGSVRAIAKSLGMSLSLIYKWMEPSTDFSDSGAYNPLDRLEGIIKTAIEEGRRPQEAFAPIFWLARRFGLAVFYLPAPDVSPQEVSRELLKTVHEFGDLAREASAALEDGEISRGELERIKREGEELIRQTATFVHAAEAACGGAGRNREGRRR